MTEAQDTTVQDAPASYMTGVEGYVLEVKDNDFIRKGNGETVAEHLGGCLIGMKFRPLSVSCQSDPAIEAGDPAIVTDYKQNTYQCYITNTTYQIGNYQSVSCDAKTPTRNSASRFTEATQAFVKAKKNTKVQINEYNKAVQALTSLITQSFGVYKTEEKLEDGSTVFYMHNKPTLEESDTIWKMTANAFAMSTDGGKTWNAGMDSQGNAVVNVLSAIGIRFDWARGGTLTLGGDKNVNGVLRILDASGKEIGVWDRNGVRASNVRLEGAFSNLSADKTGVVIEQNRIDYRYKGSSAGWMYVTGGGAMGVYSKNGFNIGYSRNGVITDVVVVDSDDGPPKLLGGKTGRAEFSDGSYLQFKNGVLTGGNTKEGAF